MSESTSPFTTEEAPPPSVTDLHISKLVTRKDARPVDEKTLGAIRLSIQEVGLINPLRVRPTRIEVSPSNFVNGWEVVAGKHRLEALKLLDIQYVPCIIVDDDDTHAELAMIDENLCRAELSPTERARSMHRRKELYEELYPETKRAQPSLTVLPPAASTVPTSSPATAVAVVGDDVGTTVEKADETSEEAPFEIENVREAPAEVGFVTDTVNKTGRSERAVQIDVDRGKRVAPDIMDMISGTFLDKGSYLDELKELSPEDQKARVEKDLAEDAESRRERKKTNNIVKTNAIRKIASILLKFVPKEEHDSVSALLEESDIESLYIAFEKARAKSK